VTSDLPPRFPPGLFSRLLLRAGAFAVVAAVAGVFFINLCDLIYDCGCVSLWAGGVAYCNIQTPGHPDCPFCARPEIANASLYATMGAQALVIFWPGRLGLPGRLFAGLLAFPAVVGAFGLALGILSDYWR